MSSGTNIFLTLNLGLSILHLLVTAIAVLLCWSHRRISPGMNLVVAGLVGMLLSGFLGRVLPFAYASRSWSNWTGFLVPAVVGLVSWALVVFGLAATFHDVRRAISLAKDRRHDLE